ncbi:MAG: hypothetical protein HYV63_10575 [Candidatus Schekmanbacteria bacterium]|nr:hypothetical protein [Candidatus Schekmanbacteria bacterium]
MKATTVALAMVLTFLTGCESNASDSGSDRATGLQLVSGPQILQTRDRGLFASVLVDGSTVRLAYQIAPPDTIVDDKSLFAQIRGRDLSVIAPERIAIDVTDPDTTLGAFFNGDLGDHKITLMNGQLYMVAIVKGSAQAAVLKLDLDFKLLAGPVMIGDPVTDRLADMGFANDGTSVYAQFFYQPEDSTPQQWGASLYKLDANLNVTRHAVARPDSGSFVTGTSLVFVPRGTMEATEDRLYLFSTDLDYGNANPIGIHVFAVRAADLSAIKGTTKTLVKEALDAYFPVGAAYSSAHSAWVLGYTREQASGAFPEEELGPSFVRLFDEAFEPIATVLVNGGAGAMRVMLDTRDDDGYVVYDEMNRSGTGTPVNAKVERYHILTSPPTASMLGGLSGLAALLILGTLFMEIFPAKPLRLRVAASGHSRHSRSKFSKTTGSRADRWFMTGDRYHHDLAADTLVSLLVYIEKALPVVGQDLIWRVRAESSRDV